MESIIRIIIISLKDMVKYKVKFLNMLDMTFFYVRVIGLFLHDLYSQLQFVEQHQSCLGCYAFARNCQLIGKSGRTKRISILEKVTFFWNEQ